MAEKLKFILLLIIILAIVLLLGYWTFTTLKPASVVVERQKQEALKAENEQLAAEVEDLKNQLRELQGSTQAEEPAETGTVTPPTDTTPAPTTKNKNQALINDLQKLITDKIYMKEGSRGTRVGTVQKFLNLYNNTTKPIDNDYGPGMKTDVANFQKAEGLSADGQAGPNTYQKMIDWLNK